MLMDGISPVASEREDGVTVCNQLLKAGQAGCAGHRILADQVEARRHGFRGTAEDGGTTF